MNKTTKNNPGAFQKTSPQTLLMIIVKIARKILNGELNVARNLLIAELLNYLSQKKKVNQLYCNLCKSESPYFLHTANQQGILKNSICPNCNSRKRHRGLYEIYKQVLEKLHSPIKILHFSPEPVYYELFKSFQYITADIELEDVDIQLNIKNIDYDSNTFDLILCNHVLEHVSDDLKAVKELERILKPSGILILTVPGDWDNKETIKFDYPERNNGHYRHYGKDFFSKLNTIITTETMDIYKFNNTYHLPLGLTYKHDLAFLCQKD